MSLRIIVAYHAKLTLCGRRVMVDFEDWMPDDEALAKLLTWLGVGSPEEALERIELGLPPSESFEDDGPLGVRFLPG